MRKYSKWEMNLNFRYLTYYEFFSLLRLYLIHLGVLDFVDLKNMNLEWILVI